MNYIWNVMISWLLLKFFVPAQSNTKEVTIPVSSPITLECNEDLRVNNIEIEIRRSNTSCWTIPEECTLPIQTIDSIKDKCNKQESCEVDIHNTIEADHCLNEYGFVNVWYTCKKILDFSCDFESDLCNWSFKHNQDRFRWEYGNRLYNIFYNKPPVDHTSASTSGKYVYIYADRSVEGDVAYLERGEIISMKQQCLSFWFFTTNTRDSVYVFQNKKLLFNLSNYENDKWHHKQTSLEMSNNFYKLVFKVIRGPDKGNLDFGAIVIDDLLIENQQCSSAILKCDFDSNLCDLKSDNSNQYTWKKQNGATSWRHSGPNTDHSTASENGYYMFLEREDTVAFLEFQNVDVTVPRNCCLTFWYHLYNNLYYEMERLNVSIDNELVWTESGNRENKWKKGTIELQKRKIISIKFIGISGNNYGNLWNKIDIAIDDISLTEGTCTGFIFHEEMCVPIDDKTPLQTYCPKEYLIIANSRLSFDPEKQECSKTYNQTKNRLLEECRRRIDSETCLIDLSADASDYPECFQLYDFHIIHTCEDEELTTLSSVITSKRYSSSDQKSTPVSSDITSGRETSEAVKTTTSFTSSESSSAGLTVGLVIGALLLVCAVLVIIILIRRHTWSNPGEKIKNNIGENDYIGSQDIALPLAANHSRHMQNTGKYNGSSDTSLHANAHNNTVHHDYTNVGAVNGLVNNDVQVPTYARRQDKPFADNHMPNDDEYAVVDPTAETSFNKTTYNRTGTADHYMVLDPTQTGFNRQILSNTPVGYEFAKPVRDTENKMIEDDQYAISDVVYDHSGNNRHKESEDNIYNHAVDTIYDSGSHKRNEKGTEDTYDHFFGETTEDDYNISTTT